MFTCIQETTNLFILYISVLLIQKTGCIKTIYLNDYNACWPYTGLTEVSTFETLRIIWTGKNLNFYDRDYCMLKLRGLYNFDFDFKTQLCFNLKELRIPCGQKLEFYDTGYFSDVNRGLTDRTYRCGSRVQNEEWCGDGRYATLKLFTENADVSASQYSMTLEVYVKRTEIHRTYTPGPSDDYSDDDDEEDRATTTYIIIAAVIGFFFLVCCCACCCASSKKKDTTDETNEGTHIPLQPSHPGSTGGVMISVPEPTTTWDPVTQQEVTIHPLVSVNGTSGHSSNFGVDSRQQSHLGLDTDVILPTAPEWEPTDQQETTGPSAPPPKYTDLFPEKS